MNLRDTNPAPLWLRQRFAVNLPLVSGQHIVVRFDLDSTGVTGYRFNEQNVEREFGQLILGDRKNINIEEYLSLCATVADVLNDKVDQVAVDCLRHARESLYLLDALDNKDWEGVKRHGINLGVGLIAYGSHADKVWGNWLESLAEHLN